MHAETMILNNKQGHSQTKRTVEFNNNDSQNKYLLRFNDQILHLSTIEDTKCRLTTSLNQIQGLPPDFISTDRLLRPSFSFIHNIIKIFVQKLSFASNLYDDEEELLEKDPQSLTRQEKIKFLFKMLTCVSLLMNERMDILVSPAKVLTGQDVHMTLLFFQCLSKAAEAIPPEQSMEVAKLVLEKGVTAAYKKSIKIRSTIVRIQSTFRGWAIRRKLSTPAKHSIQEHRIQCSLPKAKKEDNPQENSCRNESTNPMSSIVERDKKDSEKPSGSGNHTLNTEKESRRKSKRNKTTKDYRKKDPKLKIDCPLPTENEREIHLDSKGKRIGLEKSRTSLTTIPEKKVVKKFKIVNGIKTKQDIEIIQHVEKSPKTEKKNEEEDVAVLLVNLKTKMKNLQKREEKLNDKIEAARQKEEHLQICESRVSKLAESLRNKQERLAQERINQVMEIDKLRLEVSEGINRNRFVNDHDGVASVDSGQDDKYETLWKRACDNPTITDLRLKLEAKERSMRKRQDRMIKLEKELIKRMGEVEEEKKRVNDEKKAMNESKKKHQSALQKKRKPLTYNREHSPKSPQTRKQQKKNEAHESAYSSFHTGSLDFHPLLLQQLAQVSSERVDEMQNPRSVPKVKRNKNVRTNGDVSHLSISRSRDSMTPRRRNVKSSSLSRNSSGSNVSSVSEPKNESSKNEIPKSLVRYIDKQMHNNDLN